MSGMSSGVKLQGIINFELKDTKTGKIKRKEQVINHITPIGAKMMLSPIYEMMNHGEVGTMGRIELHRHLTKPTMGYSSGYEPTLSVQQFLLHNALLNLPPEEIDALKAQPNRNHIQVWDNQMTNTDRVTGYARFKKADILATHVKEGYMTEPVAELDEDGNPPEGYPVLSGNSLTGKWVYPPGHATGTINCIAMMSGGHLRHHLGGGGYELWKSINPTVDFSGGSTILPPGIKTSDGEVVYTNDDEILINLNQDGFNKFRINLRTGAVTKVADTENFAKLLQYYNDVYVQGDFLYVLYNTYLYVYDIRNSLSRISATSLGACLNMKFLKLPDDDNLYVTLASVGDVATTKDYLKLILDEEAGYYKYLAGNQSTNKYSDLGIILPEGLTQVNDKYQIVRAVCIGNYYEKYIMYRCGGYVAPRATTTSQTDEYIERGGYYISESLDFTQIVSYGCLSCGYITSTDSDSTMFKYPFSPSSFQKRQPYSHGIRSTFLLPESIKGFFRYITHDEPGSTGSYQAGYDYAKSSLFNINGYQISLEGWQGDTISYKLLENAETGEIAPIEKGPDDQLTVSYSYKIEAN